MTNLKTITGLDIAMGDVPGMSSVNKFGRTTNADQDVPTDVWDGANSGDDIAIWVAPTEARVHQITSTSALDDGSPVGSGARTVRVFGLPDWDTAETSQDITLNGVADVPTTALVIIHRMRVLTKGAAGVNVGVITATADTDNTVTAQINAGEGQTQMAIYGVPSTQKAYMDNFYASVLKAASATSANVTLLVNPEPDAELINFLVKHTEGLDSTGTSNGQHPYSPCKQIPGPAIIKIQVTASRNDTDMSAGFDLVLVNN